MKVITEVQNGDHQIVLVNLLDPSLNKFYGHHYPLNQERTTGVLEQLSGEFALASFVRDKKGGNIFCAARTIGVTARVACQAVSNHCSRFILAHTIREIREVWECDLPTGVGWIKPFDPRYTKMLPAFSRITILPWKMGVLTPEWFLPGPPYANYPDEELLPANVEKLGEIYIQTLREIVRNQITLIPDGTPILVSLSGGADSTSVAAVLLATLAEANRCNSVWALTLALDGGGSDLEQARMVASILQKTAGKYFHFHPLAVDSRAICRNKLKEQAALTLEEYHARDVECGMAGLLLARAVWTAVEQNELPASAYEFNGDGGNELFRDYPLEGIVSIEDAWSNPHVYLLGYGRNKLPYNETFSAGLSRAYTRTFNPAREFGTKTFSPLIDRRLVDFCQRLPLKTLAPTRQELYQLRGRMVGIGTKQVLGIELPIFPKARFQDGCSRVPGFLSISQEESTRLKQLVLGRL